MKMNDGQWEKILSAVDKEEGLSKDNVVKKIKEKLKVENEDEYRKWEGDGFDVNHLFEVENSIATLLHLAAEDDLENIASALLEAEGINVNVVNKCGWTPLFLAAQCDSKKVMDVLLKAREIDVNVKSIGGYTPLHEAVNCRHEDIINVLLKAKGINVNAVDQFGKTPLHSAAKSGCKKIARALIENEADLLFRDNKGQTPRDLARYDYMKEFLKEAEEKQLKKLNKEKNDLPQDNGTTHLLGKKEKKQPISATQKGIYAGSATALLGTVVAVALFATGTVEVKLIPIVIAVATVLAAALAVGGGAYMMLKPSTEMDGVEKQGLLEKNEQKMSTFL